MDPNELFDKYFLKMNCRIGFVSNVVYVPIGLVVTLSEIDVMSVEVVV